MAIITLEIPDDKLPVALDACARQTGWDPASGVTKGQHAKQQLWEQVKDWVRADKMRIGRQAAKDAVDAEMETW